MVTNWKWRLFLFAPLAANTAQNRNTLADVFVNQGSGETAENERKMFDSAVKLALVASPLVQVAWGISFPVKQSMRDELESAIATINTGLTNANRLRWYAVANVDLENFAEGELIQSNRTSVDGLIGSPFSFEDALSDLGLVQIVETV